MDRDGLYQTAGCIPLLKAASQGVKDTVQMLLNAGCYIDVQDEHGNSAIHEASWNGFSQTAELLVKYNCNVCLMNKAGFTALHLAAQNGHNECSRVLLYAGCNPDIKNNYGDTALHTAARYGHAGVARILISARCKISEQNKNGDTALHIAAALKRRKIAKILVESGIETELTNKQNETAVDVAKRKEYPEILLIITSYSKSKELACHQLSDEQVGVTFKKAVNSNIRSEVYQENEPLHKYEPEVDKQQEERRFFFFKKKNKKKATPMPVCGYKKPDAKHFCSGHEKPAVQGFFSHYVPQDGVQFYRDLAGNIKQGPIGYAPVCQCGPSLRRLENSITDTRQSLQKHITASHHLLSQQIDNLDSRTNKQGYASEILIKDRLQNEQNACNARITERLQEERQKSQAKFNKAHAGMKEELEYWLNDRLASYGHCLDHHHDDSALPPQNLFFDFATTGRLIRSKSDETLSASDYSGKFRKKDFYVSRQAAMQHIRSWDVAAFDSFSNFDRSRRKEINNNSIANSSKVVTHALMNTKENIRNIESDKSFITSSGNLTTHVSNTEKTGTLGRSGKLPWKQTIFKTTPEKDYISKRSSRVTFSKDQLNQHLEQSHHHSLSSSHSQSSPHNPTDHINLSRQNFQSPTRVTNPTSQNNMGHHTAPIFQHSYWTQQNLHEGSPPNIKLSELDDSHILLLTGQDNMYNNKNTRFVSGNQKLIHCEDKHDARTLSADTLLNEESNTSYSRNITRHQSMENAIDRDSAITTAYISGYLTDTASRQSSAGSSTQIIDNNQSIHSDAQKTSTSSCATYRHHLTESSTSQNDSLFGFHGASTANPPQQGNNNSFRQAKNLGQSPTHCNKFNKTVDPCKRRMVFPKFNHASREFIQATSLYKSVDNLDNKNTDISESELSNSDKLNQAAYPENYDFLSKPNRSFMSSEAHSVHFPLPKNNCLQNENLVNSGTRTSPAYALGNKEDSTCSSNQDSGYGSRNHGQGLKRGIDIGGGTPSSSFSAEQSGCNTPSNADSPYVHCEFSNEKMSTSTSSYHTAATTVYDNGFHFSPTVVPNKNIHSNSGGSRIYVSYAGSNYDKYNSECRDMSYVNSNFIVPSNGDLPLRDVIDCTCQGSSFYDKSPNVPPPLMSCKSIVHDLSNCNSSWYSYAVCDSNTHILTGKQIQFDAIQDTVEKSTSHRSGNSVDITEKVSSQQSAPNNHSFSFKGVTKPSKILREQADTALLTCSSGTSLLKQTQLAQSTINNNSCNNTSEGKTNNQQQNSDSMSQVAIQAHIQGWYQRKLMEAAHRLKQNHGYSQRNPEQYLLKNNNTYQGKNVDNGIHDFNVHLSNSEKSQGVMFQMCIPKTNFQIQNMCQFQNSTNKNSYTEHQQSDSLKNSGQAGVTQHTRVLPLYERNFSSSSNASHLLPVDKTYHMKTEDSSVYTSGKQLVTYSSLFYDSVRGSDV